MVIGAKKMKKTAHRNLAKPPRVLSLNRSMTQRIQMKMNAIQMKKRKLQSEDVPEVGAVEVQ